MRQALNGPNLYRAAKAEGVLDPERRTVKVSFSSEIKVKRVSWFEDPWIEILGHKSGEIDLSRFSSGAGAVLYGHNQHERAEHVGVVERAWIEGGKGFAEVRLSMRKDVEDLWRDIVDGIVRNISCGYKIFERILVKKNDKIPSEYRVTRWMPMEISFVPIPADATVGVGRSADAAQTFTITDIEENPMSRSGTPHNSPARPEFAPPPENETDAARAQRVERERVILINDQVQRSRAPAEIATRAIAEGLTIERTRELIINDFADRDVNHTSGLPDIDHVHIDAYEGPRDDFDRALVDGMLLRAGIRVDKPLAAARDTRRMSTIEMMRSYLGHHGQRAGTLSVSELVTRAMTTSDFPLLMTNAAGAALRRGYEDEPASHRAWTRAELVPDFKEQARPILGSAPSLEKVTEANEFTDGSLTEDSTSYRIDTYGRIVGVTRQVLVNDQLGAFLRLQPAMGAAAARLEADLVYAMLLENAGAGPTMQDGVVLFHANHANLGTAGSWSLFLLSAARTLLRKQTALGGGQLSLVPRFVICPAELETDVEVAIAAASRHVNTATSNNAVVGLAETPTPNWASSLQIVVEPRLPATAFYLATDTALIDTAVVGRLDENGGAPVFQVEDGFRKDGVSFKIRHDFGVKFLDWRGVVKAPIG